MPVRRSSRAIRSSPGVEPLASVHHQHEQVGADDGALALLDDELVQRILALAVEAAGIKQLERRAAPDDRTSERIARRTGNRRNDRAATARHPVEKRGFPHVWSADEHD